MVNVILVKIAPLGRAVTEVMIPEGSTVSKALEEAQRVGVTISGYDDLRKNGKPVNSGDGVLAGDIITLIPQIRGGN
jgi:hypothetical protein